MTMLRQIDRTPKIRMFSTDTSQRGSLQSRTYWSRPTKVVNCGISFELVKESVTE